MTLVLPRTVKELCAETAFFTLALCNTRVIKITKLMEYQEFIVWKGGTGAGLGHDVCQVSNHDIFLTGTFVMFCYNK